MFAWDSGSSVSANLFQRGWGEDISFIDNYSPDKPGGSLMAIHRLWYVGPFGVQRVLYERPPSEGKGKMLRRLLRHRSEAD